MKVMKFGGTSVGSVNSILTIKKIVESVDEPVIVVVSAVGGVTDMLIKTSKLAAAGDAEYQVDFQAIRDKLAGQTIAVSLDRNGQTVDVTVTLEERPVELTSASASS
jgi:aspartokinase